MGRREESKKYGSLKRKFLRKTRRKWKKMFIEEMRAIEMSQSIVMGKIQHTTYLCE